MTFVARLPRWPYALLLVALLGAAPLLFGRTCRGMGASPSRPPLGEPPAGARLRVTQDLARALPWQARSARFVVDGRVVWAGDPAQLRDAVVFDGAVAPGVRLIAVEVLAEEALVDSRLPATRVVRRTAAVRVGDGAPVELAVEARASTRDFDLRFAFR